MTDIIAFVLAIIGAALMIAGAILALGNLFMADAGVTDASKWCCGIGFTVLGLAWMFFMFE